MTTISHIPHLADANHYHPASRLWVYITDRPLNQAEIKETEQALEAFTRQWTAHNQQLKAVAEMFQGRILILMVDESQAGASGCSIDKSIHFLESLGRHLQVDFFNRMLFAWINPEGNLEVSDRMEFQELLDKNMIGPDTLVINTLVQTRADLSEKWLLPYGKSWMPRLFN